MWGCDLYWIKKKTYENPLIFHELFLDFDILLLKSFSGHVFF